MLCLVVFLEVTLTDLTDDHGRVDVEREGADLAALNYVEWRTRPLLCSFVSLFFFSIFNMV